MMILIKDKDTLTYQIFLDLHNSFTCKYIGTVRISFYVNKLNCQQVTFTKTLTITEKRYLTTF